MTRRLPALALALALLLAPTVALAAPEPEPAPQVDVPALIVAAAERHGVDAGRMVRLAWCESRYQPWVTSPWGHRGVFQFDQVTWAEQAPTEGLSPDFALAYDAEANVWLAASLMARGQWWRWRGCW